jgi:hypothetical protein
MRRKLLGPEHADVAVTLVELGRVYQDLGLNRRADPLLRESLVVRRKVLGDAHRETAVSLNAVASVLRLNGDLAGGSRCCSSRWSSIARRAANFTRTPAEPARSWRDRCLERRSPGRRTVVPAGAAHHPTGAGRQPSECRDYTQRAVARSRRRTPLRRSVRCVGRSAGHRTSRARTQSPAGRDLYDQSRRRAVGATRCGRSRDARARGFADSVACARSRAEPSTHVRGGRLDRRRDRTPARRCARGARRLSDVEALIRRRLSRSSLRIRFSW